MQINCIAIEDEPLALKKLVGFIDKIEYLHCVQTFNNCIEAISYLKKNTIDLIFLDIQMEDFTGIQFLETVTHRPAVIITTAYDKYALQGYELDVVDYLLKPFTLQRFINAVDKAYNNISAKANAGTKNYTFLKTEYRLEKVQFNDILYIEGKGEYLQVVTTQKKIMTLQNFRAMLDILPANNFIRIHKSYIVAIEKIESIERNRIKIQDVMLPISETYKEEFYSKINRTQ